MPKLRRSYLGIVSSVFDYYIKIIVRDGAKQVI